MDDHQRLANRFHQELAETIRTLSREIGYRAPRFAQMLGEHGGVATTQILLRGPGTSEGFQILMEHGRLAQSVEAYVLRPEYAELFTDAEREIARFRLQEHGFSVEAYLRSLADED